MECETEKGTREESGPFIIYGAGGHAKVVFEVCAALGLEPMFIDDVFRSDRKIFGRPVGCAAEIDWKGLGAFRFIIAIGDNAARGKRFAELIQRGGTALEVAHPSAVISRSAKVGRGSVVMAGAIVSAEAVIGENCIINTGARIDHDCVIGANSHIGPGAVLAGGVQIGMNTWIGAGSVCVSGVKIEGNSVVGAGSIMLR